MAKRRLRLAEAAAHRRGLDGTLASYREDDGEGGAGASRCHRPVRAPTMPRLRNLTEERAGGAKSVLCHPSVFRLHLTE